MVGENLALQTGKCFTRTLSTQCCHCDHKCFPSTLVICWKTTLSTAKNSTDNISRNVGEVFVIGKGVGHFTKFSGYIHECIILWNQFNHIFK